MIRYVYIILMYRNVYLNRTVLEDHAAGEEELLHWTGNEEIPAGAVICDRFSTGCPPFSRWPVQSHASFVVLVVRVNLSRGVMASTHVPRRTPK